MNRGTNSLKHLKSPTSARFLHRFKYAAPLLANTICFYILTKRLTLVNYFAVANRWCLIIKPPRRECGIKRRILAGSRKWSQHARKQMSKAAGSLSCSLRTQRAAPESVILTHHTGIYNTHERSRARPLINTGPSFMCQEGAFCIFILLFSRLGWMLHACQSRLKTSLRPSQPAAAAQTACFTHTTQPRVSQTFFLSACALTYSHTTYNGSRRATLSNSNSTICFLPFKINSYFAFNVI